MDCLEFRRRIGAEPSLAGSEIEAHRRDCPACARYQDELRAMDAQIAREVIGHIQHETGTLDTKAPLTPADLATVLDPDGTRLRPDVGDVTFAARCVFDGRVVPHLVVRMPQGPVTVLLLRHRSVGETVRIAEQGYTGVVMPAPRGSIAVVGRDQKDLDVIARQVFEAVDWGG